MSDRQTNGHPANLAQDAICDGLRVSTGIFRSCHSCGWYDQYETWIFSDIPGRRSDQIIHGTCHCKGQEAPYVYNDRLLATALRVHDHIVANLRKEQAQ